MVSFIRFAPQEAMSCCIAFKHPEVGDSWNPMRPVQCQTSKSLKGANHPSSDFFLSFFLPPGQHNNYNISNTKENIVLAAELVGNSQITYSLLLYAVLLDDIIHSKYTSPQLN